MEDNLCSKLLLLSLIIQGHTDVCVCTRVCVFPCTTMKAASFFHGKKKKYFFQKKNSYPLLKCKKCLYIYKH